MLQAVLVDFLRKGYVCDTGALHLRIKVLFGTSFNHPVMVHLIDRGAIPDPSDACRYEAGQVQLVRRPESIGPGVFDRIRCATLAVLVGHAFPHVQRADGGGRIPPNQAEASGHIFAPREVRRRCF
jgi:hypothetical protein